MHTTHTKGKSELFFRKIVDSFKDSPEYEVILAVGAELKGKIANTPNIHVVDWISQKAMLNECDLFITHAGINSIMESVLANVPMIAYPLDKWDLNGNAARLKYHGLGLPGNLYTDSIDDIRNKAFVVLESNEIKANIEKMGTKFRESYNEDWMERLGLTNLSNPIYHST